MHFIIRGLYGKHGGTDTLSKYWLYVVYNIYSGRNNVVDLPEVLWQDIRKFAIKGKDNEISSPGFWDLIIQELYKERSGPIFLWSCLKIASTNDGPYPFRIYSFEEAFGDFDCVHLNTVYPSPHSAHYESGQANIIRTQDKEVCKMEIFSHQVKVEKENQSRFFLSTRRCS